MSKEPKSNLSLENLVGNFRALILLSILRKFNFDHRVNCIVLFRETNHVDWNFIVLLNLTDDL